MDRSSAIDCWFENLDGLPEILARSSGIPSLPTPVACGLTERPSMSDPRPSTLL